MTYDPNQFIDALTKTIGGEGKIPKCPICGGQSFTTTDNMASILIGNDMDSVSIGPTIPAGMAICNKCGHIDFYALGVLGLIKKEVPKDGEKEK